MYMTRAGRNGMGAITDDLKAAAARYLPKIESAFSAWKTAGDTVPKPSPMPQPPQVMAVAQPSVLDQITGFFSSIPTPVLIGGAVIVGFLALRRR